MSAFWVQRREKEESAVNRESGCEEGQDLQVVELASEVGFPFWRHHNENHNNDENSERLDSSAQRLHEDGDEDHRHFSVHDDTFPVVVLEFVAVVEKSKLALHFLVGESFFLFLEKDKRKEGNTQSQEQETGDASNRGPQNMIAFETQHV